MKIKAYLFNKCCTFSQLKIGPWLNYRVRTKTETSAENMRIVSSSIPWVDILILIIFLQVFSLCLLSLLLQLGTSCNKIREIIQSVVLPGS